MLEMGWISEEHWVGTFSSALSPQSLPRIYRVPYPRQSISIVNVITKKNRGAFYFQSRHFPLKKIS